ncbi:MAG TPA: T9SS type A sorting domain-containing protein [Ignavibacteriaceae bacterium]|nr:T9SS type A sorting domain-containing protein [Ignavibacteriaceae bacterium]
MKLSLIHFSIIFAFTGILYSQQVYYPLTIGNRWEYEGLGAVTAEVIKDTVIPNQVKYALIQYDIYTFEFLRQDSNKVYEYNILSEKEELLYDFSRSSGDTIAVIPREEDTTDIILISKDSIEIFGISRLHFTFAIDYLRRAIDDEKWVDITDSIGPTAITRACCGVELVRAWIDGIYYGTVDVEKLEKDLSFSLDQNYPNPFNPTTTITYSIPFAGTVSLKIYDILGRESELLVNDFMSAGEHTAIFNSANLSSVIYFYELKAGKYRSVRKMMLLK